MTARDIQRRLILDRWDRSTVFPNFTPAKWWECDVFELTKAGFFREYEIKLTRSDFRIDAKKIRKRWTRNGNARAHDGPCKFYFVAPAGVIPLNELPEWAGLIVCETRTTRAFKALPGTRDVFTHVEKEAPQLHKVKAVDSVLAAVHKAGYWRFLRALLHNDFTTRNETETEKENGAVDQDARRDQTENEAQMVEAERPSLATSFSQQIPIKAASSVRVTCT